MVTSKQGRYFQNDQRAVHSFVKASVNSYKISGLTKLRLLTGQGSELILPDNNPYPNYYSILGLNLKFAEYKKNSQKLPLLENNQVSNLLLPYKITAIK